MTDDDPLKAHREYIAAGKPLVTYVVEPPIRLSILPGGSIQFDSPMALYGIDQAGIQRTILAVSADSLRAALKEIESKNLAFVELRRAPSDQQ